MTNIQVTASFADNHRAQTAIAALTAEGMPSAHISITTAANDPNLDRRETRFMGRIVLIIAAASVAGTAIGAIMGAALAYTIGPSGTDGLILQVVTWAIFAHLLIGMWAGYLLLADRTERDLPSVRPGHDTTLIATCPSQHVADRIAQRLRELGATDVSSAIEDPAPPGHAASQTRTLY